MAELDSRPTVLVYSRRMAAGLRDWLTAHEAPANLYAASNPDEAAGVIDRADILFGAGFPADLYPRAQRLRWIQSFNAGVDDLVSTPGLPEQVVLTRITDQFGGYIAEYVFAELLARTRELERTRAAQRERRWDHFIAGTLAGRVLGVAGLGSIGAEIVRKGRAFDMTVHGLSRTSRAAGLVDRHFAPEQWVEFAAGVDALVLTLPRTPATENVVDESVLAAMRPDAVLVNVGRGALIDDRALIETLRAGRIGGAVLDVFREEPLPPESPYWTLPNTVVTPHISGPSTVEGVGAYFLANLQRYLAGHALTGVVDRQAGY